MSRSWKTSTPPRSARREDVVERPAAGRRVADEVQARACSRGPAALQRGLPWRHGSSREQAERAASGRRPSEPAPGHAGEGSHRHLPHADVAVVGGGVIGLAVAWRARSAGCESSCRPRRARRPAPRAWPPGCSRRSPRPTRRSARCCAPASRARALLAARSPTSCADVSGVDVGLPRAAARCWSPATATRPRHWSASSSCASAWGCASSACCGSEARRRSSPRWRRLRLALDVARRPRGRPARARPPRCRGVRARAASSCARDTEVATRRAARGARRGRRRRLVSAGLAPLPVRPVKGQSAPSARPAAPACASASLRYETGYLVPRGDGRYFLGATMEERGFDTAMTARAVHELLRDAAELVPGHPRAARWRSSWRACAPARRTTRR